MSREIVTITLDQAQDELDGMLRYPFLDSFAFARGNFCMRVLGCPVSDKGKPLVIEDQPGDEARDMWNAFEDTRAALNERHQNWLETQDFGE